MSMYFAYSDAQAAKLRKAIDGQDALLRVCSVDNPNRRSEEARKVFTQCENDADFQMEIANAVRLDEPTLIDIYEGRWA